MDIQITLVVDILLLVASVWCVLQVSERSIFNPTIWYLALHAYAVTFRLVTLNLGTQSMSVIGVRSDMEMVTAAIASDLSLLVVVAATIMVARRTDKDDDGDGAGNDWARLSPRLGQVISILCLTVGTYALLKFGAVASAAKARGADISAIDIGRFEVSSYPVVVAGFAVQGALIQCAIRGFTRWRVVLLLLLLALSSFNLPRTVFVLGVVMAFLIYQARRNQHYMPVKWAIGVLLLGIIWFVYKPVAQGMIAGDDVETTWAAVENYVEDSTVNNSSIDTQFLDMQATYMAASDEAGHRFYGATILPLLYLPIPRFLWPDKPRQNEYAQELSTPLRMMSQTGMTPNLTGESYVNFGWIGCAVIPFLYVGGMQMAYHRVNSRGISSAARWIYLIYLLSMVQIFRDGLNSLILYPFLEYLPLLTWGVISLLMPTDRVHVTRALDRRSS
jgi:hypothetical protein